VPDRAVDDTLSCRVAHSHADARSPSTIRKTGGMAEQTYCDWCAGPLSPAARAQSRAIGLNREDSYACEECVRARRFERPPNGWDESYPWPFYPWPYETDRVDGDR
jgi:hypothetical protein